MIDNRNEKGIKIYIIYHHGLVYGFLARRMALAAWSP